MQLFRCRHACFPILHGLDIPDYTWFHLESTQVVLPLLGLVEIQDNSISPVELYPERPCHFMAAVPAWANHCDSCCALEMQWTCWRPLKPHHPRKNPKWPLHWSLTLSSGGSEHSAGRTEKDWFSFTTLSSCKPQAKLISREAEVKKS